MDSGTENLDWTAAVLRRIGDILRFVEGRPRNNRWMISVAQKDLAPLAKEISRRDVIVYIAIPTRCLGPGYISEAVRPVMVAFLENFLMQARTVESGGLCQLDIGFQRLLFSLPSEPTDSAIIKLDQYAALAQTLS